MSSNKERSYYSLVECIDFKWSVQFGDYSRKVVQQEKKDMLYCTHPPIKAANLKIIKTGPEQWQIDLAVHQLNFIPLYRLQPAHDPDAWMGLLAWILHAEIGFQKYRFENNKLDDERTRAEWYVSHHDKGLDNAIA